MGDKWHEGVCVMVTWVNLNHDTFFHKDHGRQQSGIYTMVDQLAGSCNPSVKQYIKPGIAIPGTLWAS
ncbi:hypothetical protein I79_001084 [Cricetulus griseus]|uniref:Uncharacterized protein n=1 Tax=Cricetulus griseus TaxID=10029 RepID=G3GTU5_CRIGR|nr:hypothetical protein I79_001084 [Cricetulus griseus]